MIYVEYRFKMKRFSFKCWHFSYNSYNMDEDDADHMVYLESSRCH